MGVNYSTITLLKKKAIVQRRLREPQDLNLKERQVPSLEPRTTSLLQNAVGLARVRKVFTVQ